MVEQYTENQYDDDLTIGNEEYDDSYYTGEEDLFEYSPDEESPISRLKSLILSIDWEITDEVLLMFNEELVALRDTWAGDTINLVYVQALEKISKYIYYKKAESHPSAIKLLLTLYHNLEKIVSSEDWTEDQKKELLLEDVKRFENLKLHIKKGAMEAPVSEPPAVEAVREESPVEIDNELLNLKAIVLGIDWEITDQDLNDLRIEVVALEKKFSDSKPRLVLLQGIGTLGAYIKLKKSNAHAEAFKVLHLFYESLEKIVTTSMSLEEEKAILFPAVEKFNSFKALLGPTISEEAISRDKNESEPVEAPVAAAGIAPAFADIPEDQVHGFQADEEAQALGFERPEDVVSHVSDFFPDDVQPAAAEESALLGIEVGEVETDDVEDVGDVPDSSTEQLGLAGFDEPSPVSSGVDAETALQGVDVETDADDDSDEEGLPQLDGKLAPALSVGAEDDDHGSITSDSPEEGALDGDIEGVVANFFGELEESEEQETDFLAALNDELEQSEEEDSDAESTLQAAEETFEDGPVLSVDAETALQGVDVETDADDDSDEEPLPFEGESLAPALATDDAVVGEAFETSDATEDEQQILDTIDGYFGEEDSGSQVPALEGVVEEEVTELESDSSELDGQLDNVAEPTLQAAEETFEDGPVLSVDAETALQGVDVETDADDDSDEEPLPFEGESLAPALATDDAIVGEAFEASDATEDEQQILNTIDGFFGEEDSGSQVPALEGVVESVQVATLAAESPVATPGVAMVSELLEEEQAVPDNVAEEIVFVLVDENEQGSVLTIQNLRQYVESLMQGGDEMILQELLSEIETLRETWTGKPLQLTFLQLFSTVADYMEMYHSETDSESFILLQSLSQALAAVEDADRVKRLEMLFDETGKVLKWQESMIVH